MALKNVLKTGTGRVGGGHLPIFRRGSTAIEYTSCLREDETALDFAIGSMDCLVLVMSATERVCDARIFAAL